MFGCDRGRAQKFYILATLSMLGECDQKRDSAPNDDFLSITLAESYAAVIISRVKPMGCEVQRPFLTLISRKRLFIFGGRSLLEERELCLFLMRMLS